jgi:hypothetical protein
MSNLLHFQVYGNIKEQLAGIEKQSQQKSEELVSK